MGASLLWRLFLPFGLGYFLSYLFRMVNAVIAPELLVDISMTAGEIGLVSGTYLICFAAFQLPLGILLDRYEPRQVLALLLLLAAAGAIMFATAQGILQLMLGRGLIGLGVSACLMAAFKTYSHWFSVQRLPLVNGLQLTAGGLGALAATRPVALIVDLYDWRILFWGLAGACLLVSLLVYWLVPRHTVIPHGETLRQQLCGTWQIITQPAFYRRAPASMLAQSAFAAIQGLWLGLWLRDIEGLSAAMLSQQLFLVALGMCCGFFSLGWLADRLQHRGLSPNQICAAGMVIFLVLQLLIFSTASRTPGWVWCALGFFGTSGTLMFAVLSQHFPRQQLGRVNTSLNLMIFLGAFLMQWGIGLIAGFWGTADALPLVAYQTAFGVCALMQLLGLLWLIGGGICSNKHRPDR
ncbi:MFS transporter [Pontibacter sp. JAM-7]|uniref:MFS transporter n=1 Tax=Pontibacter sp. JAM-7 TaxID=3366581 RepID=UPI003AF6CE7B